ncbi:MAG: hypothetical protein H6791_00415 [Candidatus Nomurabacteria bacterium]|nr:MAG: hypothetical protein H6791_00415 [Candidatus Nomurabacteria bacterium]
MKNIIVGLFLVIVCVWITYVISFIWFFDKYKETKDPGYPFVFFTLIVLLGFAHVELYTGIQKRFADIANKATNTNKHQPKKRKTLRDYLRETSFTFDLEDENRLISKNNPGLVIRVSKGHSIDDVNIYTNRPHELNEEDEICVTNQILFIRNFFYHMGSHEINIYKSPAAKWEDFSQELIETIFNLYEGKYQVEEHEA